MLRSNGNVTELETHCKPNICSIKLHLHFAAHRPSLIGRHNCERRDVARSRKHAIEAKTKEEKMK